METSWRGVGDKWETGGQQVKASWVREEARGRQKRNVETSLKFPIRTCQKSSHCHSYEFTPLKLARKLQTFLNFPL